MLSYQNLKELTPDSVAKHTGYLKDPRELYAAKIKFDFNKTFTKIKSVDGNFRINQSEGNYKLT